MAYASNASYSSYVDGYGTTHAVSYVHNYATVSTYIVSTSNSFYGYSGSYEFQEDTSYGRTYGRYSLTSRDGYASAYSSESYYAPQLGIYDFSSSTSLPDYAHTSYYISVDDLTGDSTSTLSYNSGRNFGYVFVTITDYNAFQYGVGDYYKTAYYAASEGYYSAQRGVQGMFPNSSYYYYASYTSA